MERTYNPDVLNCLANLSNDEVFTPPALANQVLDLLPQELFESPETTFLDPFTKSGVFLREIVKRLDRGLTPLFPISGCALHHFIRQASEQNFFSRRPAFCSTGLPQCLQTFSPCRVGVLRQKDFMVFMEIPIFLAISP